MKTTLDLPDALLRRVKIRATSEGRKLKELISDLLEAGLAQPPPASLSELEKSQPAHVRNPATGRLVARTLGTPGLNKVRFAESLAAIEQANEEEALSRAGNSR